MTMADRIAVLHEGRLQQIGTPREVYETPASTFVARFIGAANIFEVTAIRAENGRLNLTIAGGLAMTALDDGRPWAGGRINAVVRPEKIRVGADRPDMENRFRGRLSAIAYGGAVMRCQVAIGGDVELVATLPAEPEFARLSVGDEVQLGWPAASTILAPND